jgi:hypothetical protein
MCSTPPSSLLRTTRTACYSLTTWTTTEGNAFGVTVYDTYNFISAGYYIFVKLAPGVHTIHTHGVFDHPGWGGPFTPDVTFVLTVK